jgi:Ca2+/H+ antiporter, TMEM165/GDT1 family
MMAELAAALTAFALVAPVELPDKTFVATLVLSTRYRPLWVWLGATAAFGVQCALAAAAGQLLTLLPTRPVRFAAAALFIVGALVLLRAARRGDGADAGAEYGGKFQAGTPGGQAGWRQVGASFAVLFTAEWGDLSQLLVASLVAGGRPAPAVFVGAWLALAAVSGAAVLLGRALLRRVRLSVVRYVAAAVCAVLAVFTLVEALR